MPSRSPRIRRPAHANKLIDVSKQPGNDSGGAGGVSTAGDYLRYCQAMLNGGQLDGARILSRSTVKLMTSDHLGSSINTAFNPGMLLMGVPGYTFGLGFMVRQGDGIAPVHGSQGSSCGQATPAPSSGPIPRSRSAAST